jgi:branched-chain amino acid transport system substrate-binding protein
VVAAERLAFAQQGGSVGSFRLLLRTVSSSKPSDNARTAVQDPSAIAYIGESTPGSSADSAGITNAQDLLQVSPTDTALELTQATAAVPGAPNRFYESLKTYGRTFARLAPTSGLEATADVGAMGSLGVRRLYVADDASHYGRALAQALRQAATPRLSVVASPVDADGVFFAGSSPSLARTLFARALQSAPRVKLFAPSALGDPSSVSGLGPAGSRVYVSSPGFMPQQLSSSARRSFLEPFRRAYHHPPSPQAIFGYEAMAALLAVLRQDAGQANNRTKIIRDFFAIRNRHSVLGTYSIDPVGDTSIAPFVLSRLQRGSLVPFRPLPVRG